MNGSSSTHSTRVGVVGAGGRLTSHDWPLVAQLGDVMPVDVRKYYKRGMIIEGGNHPAICKGISPRAMPLKKRSTPTNNLKEIAARLEAARVRLAEIAATVRRNK